MDKPFGSGPGVITADGCSVDLYAMLPAGDEPDMVVAVAPAGATVLELGCGAGRVTHPLVERGYVVTAVDNSPEMLAQIRGAERVHANIEGLDLGRRFDVVLFGSHLVNNPDLDELNTWLAAAARHVSADGSLLVERHATDWFDDLDDLDEEWIEGAAMRSRLRDIARIDARTVHCTVEYDAAGSLWSQTFTTRQVDNEDLDRLAAAHGLRVVRELVDDGRWVQLVPAT